MCLSLFFLSLQFDPVTLLPNETFTRAAKEHSIKYRTGDALWPSRAIDPGPGFLSSYNFLHSPRYRFTKVICHIGWIIFCVVGLSYHLATICEGYFKYAVTTETIIQIPQQFMPPAMSLCFAVMDVIRVDLFNESSPCYPGGPSLTAHRYYIADSPPTFTPAACASYLFTLPIDQLDQHTLDFGDLFQSIWYRHPDDYSTIRINSSIETDEFVIYTSKHVNSLFKNDLKCFTVNTTANFTKGTYNTLIVNDAETEGSVLSLGMKSKASTDEGGYNGNWFNTRKGATVFDAPVLKIFTHSVHHEPRGYVVSPILCNLTANPDVTITYHKVKNILLPPPFQSACRDYDDPLTGGRFGDQQECIETCLDDAPGDGFLDISTVKKVHSVKRVRPVTSLKVRIDCVNKCPLPCKRIHFLSRLAGWIGRPQETERSVTLGAGEPDIVVTFKPRTEPFEFVIFVASCFNLWFGVSVYGSTIDFCRQGESVVISLVSNSQVTERMRMHWWRGGSHMRILMAKCKSFWNQARRTTSGPIRGPSSGQLHPRQGPKSQEGAEQGHT